LTNMSDEDLKQYYIELFSKLDIRKTIDDWVRERDRYHGMFIKIDFMNRPIKFRAWDELEKKMYYPKEIFQMQGVWWEDDPEGNLHLSLVEDSWGSRRDFVMMQYIESKDKNGKEIYEGDIITITDGKFKHLVITGTVYYDVPNAAYCVCDTKTGKSMGIGAPEIIVEVIGNVYESNEIQNLEHKNK
jgi:uncharacterized phage protein (TIGR01671 family)